VLEFAVAVGCPAAGVGKTATGAPSYTGGSSTGGTGEGVTVEGTAVGRGSGVLVLGTAVGTGVGCAQAARRSMVARASAPINSILLFLFITSPLLIESPILLEIDGNDKTKSGLYTTVMLNITLRIS